MKKYVKVVLVTFIISILVGFVCNENSYAKVSKDTTIVVEDVSHSLILKDANNQKDLNDSSFFRILKNPYILSAILVFSMIFAVIEIMTAGFGIFGTLSIIGFFLYFLGNVYVGNASMFSVLVFLLGVLLILVEITVPGFGAPGICGIISISLGIILAMGDFYFAVVSFAIALVLSLIVGLFLFKLGMKSEFFKKLQLLTSSTTSEGYVSQEIPILDIGELFITITPLRPTGYAKKKNSNEELEKIEVISSEGYIAEDREVVVTRIEGSRVYVKLKMEEI